ncbi:MAG: hypothetical protein ACRD4R_07660 [Candidatus Acidiferrales bacterium]
MRRFARCGVLLCIILACPWELRGQSSETPTLQELEKRIQELEKQVKKLERNQKLSGKPAPVQKTSAVAPAKPTKQPAAAPASAPVRSSQSGTALPQNSTPTGTLASDSAGTSTATEPANSQNVSASKTATEVTTAPAKAAKKPQMAQTSDMPGMPSSNPSAAGPEIKYPNLIIQGFADVDFSAQDHEADRVGLATGFTPPGTSSGFDLGQFVLHFSGGLSPRVSYFAEISWTAGPTGYTTTVERSIVRYTYNDYFSVSFGRYHTPIIYWNTAYHHGLWLQTTITRPELIQFGGRLIPVHFVGALAQGVIPGTGSLNLHYDVGIGNGRGADISLPSDAGPVNNNRAWLATVYAEPDWAYKWRFGGSVYHDKIGPANDIPGYYGEWIESARLIDTSETPEILAEAANIHHSLVGGTATWNSQAWYAQIAYRIHEGRWKPYYRFEYIHVPKGDPVFNPPSDPVPSLAGSVIGTRFDFSSYAALKMEYRISRRAAGEPHIQGLFSQIAVVF